jgi:hypothetical protein
MLKNMTKPNIDLSAKKKIETRESEKNVLI